MGSAKTVKILSNAIYSVGVLVVICLSGICLFGPNKAVNPDAMLPITWKTDAFIWLAFGSNPMLLACMAVYKFNDIKNSIHKKRSFILIFLPGFVCSACAVFIICLILLGYVNTLVFQGNLFK